MPETPAKWMHPNFAAALVAFQANLPSIEKDMEARVPTKSGGSYSYNYADLAKVSRIVEPALAKVGLAFTSAPTQDANGRPVLAYMLLHESGEVGIEGQYDLGSASTHQERGSAITYARRYALLSVSGVAPGGEDDDAANAGSLAAPEPAEQVIERDWIEELSHLTTVEQTRDFWREAIAQGAPQTVRDAITRRGNALAVGEE